MAKRKQGSKTAEPTANGETIVDSRLAQIEAEAAEQRLRAEAAKKYDDAHKQYCAARELAPYGQDAAEWSNRLARLVEAAEHAENLAHLRPKNLITSGRTDYPLSRICKLATEWSLREEPMVSYVGELFAAAVARQPITDKLAGILGNARLDMFRILVESLADQSHFEGQPEQSTKKVCEPAPDYDSSGKYFAALYAAGMTDAQIRDKWQAMSDADRKAICPTESGLLISDGGNDALRRIVKARRERAKKVAD